MGVDMSNPPASRTKDFFASPALSLSLAGIFRDGGAAAAAAANMEVEEGDEGSGGGRRDDTVEISSENSGPARSRSEDEFDGEGEGDEDGEGEKGKKKKRKKYHRHTAEQIREMEALFKESPHPDEKQRQQLSKQLGLAPRQVKFWFQNRRTQIKAIQERHENSLLKSEMEKLRDENKAMRETIKKWKNYEQSLGNTLWNRITSSSCSAGNDHENRSSLEFYTGIFGLRSRESWR
ncbi:Homeobox-leucine zipper protein GLABRA 2 [Vitis vinifera]|uniref:Homeobox-leucine zipper protein GLABRA 2 n=1 Tax=Vitis vinifera TaxID=29760 RepID=A0A438G3E7_VITVI|nr:Homeobox-leucine zipper protein GLABRA 2 [Vitis vinifera]